MSDLNPQSFLDAMQSLGNRGLIGTAVVGLIVGILAKVIMPGKDPGGFIITTAIGIGGSYLATYLGHQFGLFTAGNVPGFLAALVGAILILLAYRIIFR